MNRSKGGFIKQFCKGAIWPFFSLRCAMKTWNKPWIYKHLVLSFFVHLIPTTSNPRVFIQIQILVKFIFKDYCSSSKTDGSSSILQKTVDSTILNQFIYILWSTFQCLKHFLSVSATKTWNIWGTHLNIILVFLLVNHFQYQPNYVWNLHQKTAISQPKGWQWKK